MRLKNCSVAFPAECVVEDTEIHFVFNNATPEMTSNGFFFFFDW